MAPARRPGPGARGRDENIIAASCYALEKRAPTPCFRAGYHPETMAKPAGRYGL